MKAGVLTFTLIALGTTAAWPTSSGAADAPTSIDNGLIKATFTPSKRGIQQQYFARRDQQWVLVAESFVPPADYPADSTQLYNSNADPTHRFVVPKVLQDVESITGIGGQIIRLSGESNGARIVQTVSLEHGADHFHFMIDATLPKTALDVLISPFTFNIDGQPDVTHTPTLKRHKDDIIGDGVFYAPASIVQKGRLFFALAPDLDVINKDRVFASEARQHPGDDSFEYKIDPSSISMPTGLDLELRSGLTEKPLLAYGMMDHMIKPHVFWTRDNEPGSMVRELSSNRVRYAFELFVKADARPHRGYQRVSQYLWNRYAHPLMPAPKPQAMPLSMYADVCYPAYFKYQGYTTTPDWKVHHPYDPDSEDQNSWQSWEENGQKMGAFRLTPHHWYHLTYNLSWWSNISDATGLYYWGQATNNADWVGKAQRILNHTLSAPQNQGIFPGLYHLKEKRWIRNLWHPPADNYDPNKKDNYWDWEQGAYMTASASTTAGFLLQYYNTCEKDKRIVPYVKAYADFLLDKTQPSGFVPSWFDKQVNALPSMSKFNADGGLHAWVLAELYKITREQVYREGAVRLARAVEEKVIPEQRWSDFETFYSCAVKPEAFFESRTGQPGRNLLSMCWAVMGLTSTYEITGELAHLDGAEAAADFAGLFQACWIPHYIITGYTLGGFAAQLGDGEWLDQRDHRFAGPLVKLGLISGRRDLLERGVAASRASLVLLTHQRLIDNDIFTQVVYPEGLGGENGYHAGFPQTPLASGPSWSSVGGLAAAAHVAQLLGGAYVDLDGKLSIGVDGVRVKQATLDNRTLKVSLTNSLAELPVPYEESFSVQLRVHGLPDNGNYRLSVDGDEPVSVTAEQLQDYQLVISAGSGG